MGELTDHAVIKRSLDMLQGLLTGDRTVAAFDIADPADLFALYALAKAIIHDHYHGGIVPVSDTDAVATRLASTIDAIMKRKVGFKPPPMDDFAHAPEPPDRSDQLEPPAG